MKLNKNDIPTGMEGPDTIMRAQDNFGGMTVCFTELPEGTDFTPLLNGLTNDSCHCPHWGYIISGKMLIKYDDGVEETLTEGDVYYLPGGHTAIVKEPIKFIEFSPSKEFKEVMDHVAKKMAQMG
ncbi:hypothetical protein ACH3O9_11590 [Leeuwenhoekiella sp. A16]|uniref:hypothetical protein n=1 Tax=unclassified Leeuwenhoekiella TaxID=2615029 RepID=UPI003A80092C